MLLHVIFCLLQSDSAPSPSLRIVAALAIQAAGTAETPWQTEGCVRAGVNVRTQAWRCVVVGWLCVRRLKGVFDQGQSNKRRDRCRMSSIIREGDTYHGISVFGRGVFRNNERGGRLTYAGQHRSGHACGLGVATYSGGDKVYAEHGPDGQYDGRYLIGISHGRTGYSLYERGKRKEYVVVYADGRCWYNHEACAPDDPRLLALIEQVAPVEVRPAARAPHPPLATRPQAIVR